MSRQRVLDLGRVYVAATDGEHVDAAVRQVEESVGVEIAEIAQRIPAVARVCGGADVAVGRRAARVGAHIDFADHAGRALVAVVIEHLHLPAHHLPDRPRVGQPLISGDESQRL